MSSRSDGMNANTNALREGEEVQKIDRRNLIVPIGVGAAAVLILIIGWLTAPGFMTTENLLQVIRSGALIGIAALGTTFITISGNYFALSVQQTAMFCAISFAASAMT